MGELTWSDALAVSVPSMDDGHRAQAALVDAIERAVSGGDSRERIQGLLLRLVEETSDNFAVEHELMRATHFPEREVHVEEHDRLLQHISKLLASHSAGTTHVTLRVIRSLKEWLLEHIRVRDRVLGEHLVAALWR